MDEDERDEIRWAIEGALDDMANDDAAVAHSTMGDQLAMDIDDEYGDGKWAQAIVISTEGDAVAVNGDILVSPWWMKKLRLNCGRPYGACTWSEARGPNGEDAESLLHRWMERNGYEAVPRFGGDHAYGDQTEQSRDHVVDRVAMDHGYDKKDIRTVWDGHYEEYVPWTSAGTGETTVFLPTGESMARRRSTAKRPMPTRKKNPASVIAKYLRDA